MALNDYLNEKEKVLSEVSFLGGSLQIVATNQRVFRYEQGKNEAFLDLPYGVITSVGIQLERITHYDWIVGGIFLILLDLFLNMCLPYEFRVLVPDTLYLILLLVGITLIGVGALWKETKSRLEFRGKEIPNYGESDPWVLDLEKMSEEADVLYDFTKTVHEQLMERGIRT